MDLASILQGAESIGNTAVNLTDAYGRAKDNITDRDEIVNQNSSVSEVISNNWKQPAVIIGIAAIVVTIAIAVLKR
jgi:hypothetical protein